MMMRHLTDEQVIEAAEGGLSLAGARHLATCARCASRVRGLQHTLMQIGEVHVPEPSPVFWQRFAANVNAAIRESPAARQARLSRWMLGWASAAAILVISLIGFQLMRSGGDVSQSVPGTDTLQSETGNQPGSDSYDIDADEAWAVVRSLAEELHYDEAHEAGVMPHPGSVERAATELSDEERAELIRLIEDDLKRTGA